MKHSSEIRNVTASVRQRLLNLARSESLDYNLVLQRYAVERFLYRLGISSEVDRFTLKGAALFLVWMGQALRPTRDVDFLCDGPNDREAIRLAMEAVCAAPCPEDGVLFDRESIRIDEIRGQGMNLGQRVRLRGVLGTARLSVQADVGFGDVITPGREETAYPTLLDQPAPRIWAYPRETSVAEKFEAMVSMGRPNSRVKDLWDLVNLARYLDFDGETLRTAIYETFRRRRTLLTVERLESLSPAYYEDPLRARRWQEFRRQVESVERPVGSLPEVGDAIRRFLGPVCDSLMSGEPFTAVWSAGGPWQAASNATESVTSDG